MFSDSLLESWKTGEVSYDLTMAMNGALAGLVAVTAGCSVIDPWAAFLIGIVAGWCYIGMSKLLLKLKIDDAVDAIPVHFANGTWGLFAVGLFARSSLMTQAGYPDSGHQGWFFNGSDLSLLACQIAAICWIIGWVTVIMTPFFIVLNMLNLFRVDALEEEVGLDISHHRGAAYDLSGPAKEDVEELMEIRASKHGKVEVPKEEEEVDA
jgi:Amt family ammonium transporter